MERKFQHITHTNIDWKETTRRVLEKSWTETNMSGKNRSNRSNQREKDGEWGHKADDSIPIYRKW